MKKDSLISGNIGKALLLFVLPLIAGSLIQQLYTTVDAVIVGQFTGKIGLAAIDSVHTLFKFPLNFMNGLATGATIMISRYFGAKDKEGLHCAVRTALLLAGILGIVCAVAGVIFSPWLLDIMSVPEEVRAGSLIYCRIYFGGIWAMILYNMMAGVLRAFGDSKKPLYVLVVCSVVNIVADLILVGLLHTGVGGAAAATVLSQIVSVVLTAYFLVKSDFLEEKIGIRTMRICKEHMGMMINKGFPLALQSMLFPIANSIVQASINTMGTDSIAAWGICDKLDLLIWLIADSMGPVLTTYTAQNLGAGKTKRVKKGALIGTGLICNRSRNYQSCPLFRFRTDRTVVYRSERRSDIDPAGYKIYADDGTVLCILCCCSRRFQEPAVVWVKRWYQWLLHYLQFACFE